MGRLSGKIAIITGAGSEAGFGFTTVRIFAGEGAKIVMTDLASDAVCARATSARAHGLDIQAIGHDVTSETSWNEVLAFTLRHFSRLDILVNNAGVAYSGDIASTPLDAWNHHIGVNLTGTFLGCQAAVRQIRTQKSGGSIINISSSAAISAHPNLSGYVASKGGVRLLSQSAALDVAAEGIRVNTVFPGLMRTGMTMPFDDDLVKRLEGNVAVGRLGEAEHVALMNLFLASDESRYVTGAEFSVDGGLTAR
jgi:NAD(P)-dependent dehydrogenase (short-subunit alcohol dehydrogenase family)